MCHMMPIKLAQPTDIQVYTTSEMILFRVVVILLAIWQTVSFFICVPVICKPGLVIGAIFRPTAYTLTDVSSINRSDPNAGCPSVCRITSASNDRFCDCTVIYSVE